MPGFYSQSRWQEARSKKRTHRYILTLDDLPKTNLKYSQLIAQLQARYKASKELADELPIEKSEDNPI